MSTWNKESILALFGLGIAAIGVAVAIITPEVRCFFHLKSDICSSVSSPEHLIPIHSPSLSPTPDIKTLSPNPDPSPKIIPSVVLAPDPSPPLNSSPAPNSLNYDVERLRFPPSEVGTVISSHTDSNTVKRYIVFAKEKDVLDVRVLNGDITLSLRNPSGKLVEGFSRVVSWEIQLNRSGDYKIDVIAERDTDFQLAVRVQNRN